MEKRTFRLHVMYSLLEGVILGVLALNEFVFLKSLLGSNYQLSFLFQFSMVVFLFALLINEFMKRIQNKKKMLRWTALITRAPLMLLFFFPRNAAAMSGDSIYHYIFLGIFLVYYLAHPIIYPTINLFLKNTYRHQNFGRLYSWATSLNKIVMLVVTFLYGMLLDEHLYAYVYVFPLIALLGIASVFLLSRIEYKAEAFKFPSLPFFTSVAVSAREMVKIIRTNHPYRHFEIGFMFYGFAFMSSVSVLFIFYQKELLLNYSSVAFYRNSYNILAILLLPFFGRLLGKIDPRKFAVITFSSMFLYLFFVTLTEYVPVHVDWMGIRIYYTMLFFILFHSVFAATMSLLWNIGSAYFCKDQDAGTYQSIHLWLTGFRAIFAPILGVLFLEWVGFTATFGIAMAATLAGVGVMIWSYHREKRLRLSVKESQETTLD